jgi:hypothetical protein
MGCFELASSFTKQDELWKFTNHPLYEGEALGQYGQKDPIPWVLRLWEKIDRNADRREAATKVQTFEQQLDATLQEPSDEQRMKAWNDHVALQKSHGKHVHPPSIEWINALPDDAAFFAEECSHPREEFWWLKWRLFTLDVRAALDPDFADEISRGEWDYFPSNLTAPN